MPPWMIGCFMPNISVMAVLIEKSFHPLQRSRCSTTSRQKSNDPAGLAAPVAVAKGAFVEFSGRQPRQLGLEIDGARAFLPRQMLLAEADQFLRQFVARLNARHRLDHRLDLLA